MNEWYETRMWITSTVSARAGRKRFLNFSVLHNVSQEIAGLHFLDRVPGYDLQPLHQRPVLFRRDLQRLFFCTGPAETAKLQPFVEEKESVPFPDQPFNAVTASTAEQEEDILFVWIQLEVEFHNGCQSVNAPPQIRMRYSAWRIPPTRESSSAEAEFAISRTSFPFRITRSGWKTGDASGDTAGSLISAKDTDC